jgi:hypothetical protein
MGGADEQLARLVEKLVGEGFQRCALMRATVLVGENFAPPQQQDDIEGVCPPAHLNAFRAAVGDIGEFAENNIRHNYLRVQINNTQKFA